MNLKKLIFTENACYKAGKKITVQGIMVHSTGADNPWLKRYVGPDDGLLGKNKYGNHWNTYHPDDSEVCVHGFIGKLDDGSIATYQTLPWNYRGWHAGGTANDTHIGFEICEDDLTDASYFSKVYKEAVELCAYLCSLYGLTEKDIICHSEGAKQGIASNHGDVMHWFPKHGKSMDTFRADVKALLFGDKTPTVTPEPTKPNDDQLYRIRKSWDDAQSQTGAYRSLENAKNDCSIGFTVYDSNGKAMYTRAEVYRLEDFVREVQRACGATVDGIAGPETFSKTVTVSAVKNATHAVVKPIQKRLYVLGFTDVGAADGIAGPLFTKAVKLFQKANGCVVDGEITAECKTWKKLLGMQ